jgi:hypothetical protein
MLHASHSCTVSRAIPLPPRRDVVHCVTHAAVHRLMQAPPLQNNAARRIRRRRYSLGSARPRTSAPGMGPHLHRDICTGTHLHHLHLHICTGTGSASAPSGRLGSAWLSVARLGVGRRGSARLGVGRRGSARRGSAWLGSARPGSAWVGVARRGSARRGSARLGVARLGVGRRAHVGRLGGLDCFALQARLRTSVWTSASCTSLRST